MEKSAPGPRKRKIRALQCACETRRGEDPTALAQFSLSIPGSEDVVRSDERARFSDTLEEANSHDGLGLLHRCGDHCEAGPNAHHTGKEDPRLDIV